MLVTNMREGAPSNEDPRKERDGTLCFKKQAWCLKVKKLLGFANHTGSQAGRLTGLLSKEK